MNHNLTFHSVTLCKKNTTLLIFSIPELCLGSKCDKSPFAQFWFWMFHGWISQTSPEMEHIRINRSDVDHNCCCNANNLIFCRWWLCPTEAMEYWLFGTKSKVSMWKLFMWRIFLGLFKAYTWRIEIAIFTSWWCYHWRRNIEQGERLFSHEIFSIRFFLHGLTL